MCVTGACGKIGCAELLSHVVTESVVVYWRAHQPSCILPRQRRMHTRHCACLHTGLSLQCCAFEWCIGYHTEWATSMAGLCRM